MRLFLLTALAASATFCAPKRKSSPPATPNPQESQVLPPDSLKFVKAAGTQLVLGGKPFNFIGSNFYRLGLLDNKHSEKQVYEIMERYAAANVTVIRIWGFNCANSEQKLISGFKDGMPTYSETAFKRLDVAIDAAAKNGVKLIMPLINYNDEYCSMSTFANGVIDSKDTQLFYSDPKVRLAFKDYVKTVLNRVNTLTNVAYKDEPALMAIELSNEAHTEDWYERNHNIEPGELVYRWVEEMSTYVKSIDQNHLVTIGDEGYKTRPSSVEEAAQHGWLSDGTKGVDFERNMSLPNVDLACVHLYPSSWKIPKTDFPWIKENVIRDRARIAHDAGKPVLLEEIGVSVYVNRELGWALDTAAYFRDIYAATAEYGYAGNLAWELVPEGDYEDGDFIFTFSSPAGQAILY